MKLLPRALGLALVCLTALVIANCKTPEQPTRVGVPIPAPQTVGAWFVDPANTTGCASDANTCQSATCGTTGIGPCVTWHEINDGRWGCFGSPYNCPRLRQNTSVTWLSSVTGNADPVYFNPSVENGAVVKLVGQLPTAVAGTLSNVTAMVRATPQLLLAQSGATGVAQLVNDTTHSSFAWTYLLSSGSIFKMTEPLAPVVVPQITVPAEVNTWANVDAVNVYTSLPAVNLASIQPTITDVTGAGNSSNSGVYVYHLNVFDTQGAGVDPLNLNGSVFFIESQIQRILTIGGDAAYSQNIFNCFVQAPIEGGPSNVAMNVIGGAITTTSNSTVLQNGYVDGDTIVNANVLASSSGVHNASGFGTVYVETAKTLTVAGGGAVNASTSNYNAGQAVDWGPGTTNVASGTRLIHASGAGKAAATYLGTLKANGQGVACLSFPANAATTQVCNITLTAANIDTNLGATNTGCLTGGQAGGAYCNGLN